MSEDRRRVLVIEDDDDLAQALSDLLEDEGFAVALRNDGESGFAEGLSGEYHVIVLDLMLPKRNGFSVCQDLRSAGIDTPLMILTAKDGELDEVEGLDVGADDYLHKPFENSIFLARIHALLRRHERGRPKSLTIGSVELDPLRRHVVSFGRNVSLTPREFTLLEYLMGHPDETLAKTEILHAVWGSAFDGDPNIVEVYVGYLRRKIDLAPNQSMIRTVRGVGYCVQTT
jgi:two-component system OmpR family response regulator